MFSKIADSATELMFKPMKLKGQLREGISPDKARMTFISMMIFPFLAPPAMLELQGIKLDEAYLMELADHNVRVLTQGILAEIEDCSA